MSLSMACPASMVKKREPLWDLSSWHFVSKSWSQPSRVADSKLNLPGTETNNHEAWNNFLCSGKISYLTPYICNYKCDIFIRSDSVTCIVHCRTVVHVYFRTLCYYSDTVLFEVDLFYCARNVVDCLKKLTFPIDQVCDGSCASRTNCQHNSKCEDPSCPHIMR